MRRYLSCNRSFVAACLVPLLSVAAPSPASAHEVPAGAPLPVYERIPEPQPRPALTIEEIRKRSSFKNFELLGQVPLSWPGGGAQMALRGKYLYVGMQPPSIGTDIIDVSDPARPIRVGHVDPQVPGVHSHKVRICGDIMVTNAERNRFAKVDKWQGGLAVWSLANPIKPKPIAFLKTPGEGVHRITYDCKTQRVYMNTNDDGFLDKIEWVVDMRDPRNLKPIAKLWFPGQKDGEPRNWDPGHAFLSFTPKRNIHVHNVTPVGDRLYAAWWDAGLTVWDISNIAEPRLLGSASTAPPDQGSMHSAYPLRGYPIVVTSDEWFGSCPQGYVRVWNVVDPAHPLQISTFQLPSQKNCPTAGPLDRRAARLSAHVFAEAPTLDAQKWPTNLIFATWFGEGLRVIDLSDPYAPNEVGHFIAPGWPGARNILDDQSAFYAADVEIDWDRRLVFVTDRTDESGGGLYVLKWTGPDTETPIRFTPQ